MDTNELRDCTVERLMELEKTLRRQIFDGRIKNFTNQLDDTASIRRARRDLARVKTILNERNAQLSPEENPEQTAPEASDG